MLNAHSAGVNTCFFSLQVRGRDSLPASSLGREPTPREEGGGANQQLHRRLLGTMATPFYRHAPHTSFIKLEGVDSVGNVSKGLVLDGGWGSGGKENSFFSQGRFL